VLWATQGRCAKKKPPLHPVNLNTGSSAELPEAPRIAPATADKLLQARNSYGGFKSVDDLQAIKGLGPKKLDKMRKYLTVGKPALSNKTPPAKIPAPHAPTATTPPPAASPQASNKPSPKPPPDAGEDEEQ